jgi:hypothetical protein
VKRPGRRLVRELADGVGDPAPHGLAVVIVLRGEFVGARSAFLKGLVALPLEHEVSGAPDVDLGYHREQGAGCTLKIANRLTRKLKLHATVSETAQKPHDTTMASNLAAAAAARLLIAPRLLAQPVARGIGCQSAFKFDPASASNFDPLGRRALAVALAPSELVGVAETGRARVGA